MDLKARLSKTPLAVWVVALGLIYVGLALVPVAAPFLAAAGPAASGSSVLLVAPFVVIPILAAVAAFTAKRWSFLVAAAVAILFLVVFGSYLPATLANPADPTFWYAISAVPTLILVLVFSLLGAVHAKAGISHKPYLVAPTSAGGLLTFAVIGFVIGAVVVGVIAGSLINRILASSGQSADITIPMGAISATEPYAPRNFTVAHGGSVSWLNKDSIAHTVTSTPRGGFDSGTMEAGARWSHTFATPGNYTYDCIFHVQMTGTVVVT